MVEQKTSILLVLSTPNRATNTENAEKNKKIGAENVSRETFLLQTENICLNQRTIKEAMRGVSPPPSAMANALL